MATEDPQNRKREHLAFGREIDWSAEGRLGTVFFGPEKGRTFPPLPIGTGQALIKEGYLDPRRRHNEAPPAGELVEWATTIFEEYRAWQFEIGLIGYMVGPHREDSRIALEGISIRSAGPIPEELQARVTRRFTPELLTVGDFTIEVLWD